MAPQHLYDPSLYRFGEAQPSYWEATAGVPSLRNQPLTGPQSCDVAIIGGGYTGLSAALHLARDFGVDVRVLEAGHFGWGASGRNGGFCTIGGTKIGLKRLISRFGRDETRRYYRSQVEAIELVRALGADEAIDYQIQGDGEFLVADSPAHFEGLIRDSEIRRDVLGLDVTTVPRDAFREIGYDAHHQHGAQLIKPAFALHPLHYVQGLAEAAERRGAILHPHSEVRTWRKQGGRHVLETRDGALAAGRVIVACNGFMPEHLHAGMAGRALPLQSVIVVTRPLTETELAAHQWRTDRPAVNSPHDFCYYRMLPDKRLLIGARADCTGTPSGAERTAQGLRETIDRRWPHWAGIEITHSWRGLVCFNSDLRPAIGRLPEDNSVYFGFGYHGNGVNTATWTGRELAYWLAGGNDASTSTPDHLPALVRGMTRRFPFPGLRRPYAWAGIAWHRLMDRFGL